MQKSTIPQASQPKIVFNISSSAFMQTAGSAELCPHFMFDYPINLVIQSDQKELANCFSRRIAGKFSAGGEGLNGKTTAATTRIAESGN
jgi:hypothetical protein